MSDLILSLQGEVKALTDELANARKQLQQAERERQLQKKLLLRVTTRAYMRRFQTVRLFAAIYEHLVYEIQQPLNVNLEKVLQFETASVIDADMKSLSKHVDAPIVRNVRQLQIALHDSYNRHEAERIVHEERMRQHELEKHRSEMRRQQLVEEMHRTEQMLAHSRRRGSAVVPSPSAVHRRSITQLEDGLRPVSPNPPRSVSPQPQLNLTRRASLSSSTLSTPPQLTVVSQSHTLSTPASKHLMPSLPLSQLGTTSPTPLTTPGRDALTPHLLAPYMSPRSPPSIAVASVTTSSPPQQSLSQAIISTLPPSLKPLRNNQLDHFRSLVKCDPVQLGRECLAECETIASVVPSLIELLVELQRRSNSLFHRSLQLRSDNDSATQRMTEMVLITVSFLPILTQCCFRRMNSARLARLPSKSRRRSRPCNANIDLHSEISNLLVLISRFSCETDQRLLASSHITIRCFQRRRNRRQPLPPHHNCNPVSLKRILRVLHHLYSSHSERSRCSAQQLRLRWTRGTLLSACLKPTLVPEKPSILRNQNPRAMTNLCSMNSSLIEIIPVKFGFCAQSRISLKLGLLLLLLREPLLHHENKRLLERDIHLQGYHRRVLHECRICSELSELWDHGAQICECIVHQRHWRLLSSRSSGRWRDPIVLFFLLPLDWPRGRTSIDS